MRPLLLLVPLLCGAAADPLDVKEFLSSYCMDCHDSSRAKGGINFEELTGRLAKAHCSVEDADLLRRARVRLAGGIMPPSDHDQPTHAEREAAIAALLGAGKVRAEDIVPPATAPRRLNHAEYANTIRDLFDVAVADVGTLPADDVGAGFDNVASVLSLSPAMYERMVELAEGIAARACPDADAVQMMVQRVRGNELQPQGNVGRAGPEGFTIWSNGVADRDFTLPRDGIYAVTVTAFGMQAGPEPAHMAVTVNGKSLATFDVPFTSKKPGALRAELELPGGTRRIGAAFLNDYYVDATPKQDRNLVVMGVRVEGPLDTRTPKAWKQRMERETGGGEGGGGRGDGSNAAAETAWLTERVLRRPCTAADRELLAKATAGVEGGRDATLRASIVALLVHPEFLFRIEADPAKDQGPRDLSPYEIATRLSYFLWASTPDEELLRAARDGTLATQAGRAVQVARMLRDPRSSSLSERFAPQWLGIDGLETRMPDPARFAGIDAALLRSMRSETVLLFDTVLRENRPATELLDANYTFVDAPLAAHYGMPAPHNGGMSRVPAPADRGGGVLAHASVLLATSNPTRTSPVKRGKWVLESMLDCAPPPPPPGVPALPERAEDRHGLTLRQTMEQHRLDPNCASCHRQLDAMGFALEHYDAVGKYRDRADGAPVDASGELPDGRRVGSMAEVRTLLVNDPDYIRSLTKHLLIYATGRGASPADEAAVDVAVAAAGAKPTLRDLVVSITESPAFLRRGTP